MKRPVRLKRNTIRGLMSNSAAGREAVVGVTILLGWLFVGGFCSADSPSHPPASIAGPAGTIIEGNPLTADEVRGLSNAIVRVEERGINRRWIEGEIDDDGVERKIYLLKLNSGAVPDREILELQKSLLQNQLAVMKVLGVLGAHQGMLGHKLARMDNLDREMVLGMKDAGDGMDNVRVDLASNLAETVDVAEITSRIHEEVLEIQKQISNLESAIDDVAGTTDEVLEAVDSVPAGGF